MSTISVSLLSLSLVPPLYAAYGRALYSVEVVSLPRISYTWGVATPTFGGSDHARSPDRAVRDIRRPDDRHARRPRDLGTAGRHFRRRPQETEPNVPFLRAVNSGRPRPLRLVRQGPRKSRGQGVERPGGGPPPIAAIPSEGYAEARGGGSPVGPIAGLSSAIAASCRREACRADRRGRDRQKRRSQIGLRPRRRSCPLPHRA